MFGWLKRRVSRPHPSSDPWALAAFDVAKTLVRNGDNAGAVRILNACLARYPDTPELHFVLGDAHRNAGNADAACAAYRAYLVCDPADTLGASIQLYLLGQGAQPASLPLAYVRHLFDEYAPRFEDILLNRLEYRVNDVVAREVTALHPAAFARVLDVGCGTGLSAAPFVGRAAHIDGLDISAPMLERAREKGIYVRLHHTSFDEFIKTPRDAYNLILCADVLIYAGHPAPLCAGASALLAPGGLFAFTVQSCADGMILGPDHRYSHGDAFITSALERVGLTLVSKTACTLRLEENAPVAGAVFIARR